MGSAGCVSTSSGTSAALPPQYKVRGLNQVMHADVGLPAPKPKACDRTHWTYLDLEVLHLTVSKEHSKVCSLHSEKDTP